MKTQGRNLGSGECLMLLRWGGFKCRKVGLVIHFSVLNHANITFVFETDIRLPRIQLGLITLEGKGFEKRICL